MKAAFRVGLATAAFCVGHSLIASNAAKNFAARLLGNRRRDGAYRLFYNAQAVVTLGVLVTYVRRMPPRRLYEVSGAAAGLMRFGQLAGIAWAFWAVREVGIFRLAGVANLAALLRDEPIPTGPAAQGPEEQPRGTLSTGAPFRWSRHPLNLAPVPVFWLTPRLTTRRAAFNLVATAYLMLGSRHEEHRLRLLYGDRYEKYRGSGVPFFLPKRPSRTDLTPA